MDISETTGRVVGFFPGLGSRAAYRDLSRDLLDQGGAEVAAIYTEAARAFGVPGQPERLLLTPENLPASRMARQGFIGVGILVHGIALRTHLQTLAARAGIRFRFAAYTGDSFGILTSAVASGSLSVADGVRIARVFTPLLVQAAEGIGDGDAFEREVAAYLGPVRGHALVPEPHHMMALTADPADLAELLGTLARVSPAGDVTAHRTYTARQTNVYVRIGARAAFDRVVRGFPAVTVAELKQPTTFLAHCWQMGPARAALAKFIDDNGIVFGPPRTAIVANHGPALLTTAAEVREGVLSTHDRIMASLDTVETMIGLAPDLVLELGPGGRSLALLSDNDAGLPMTACSGTAAEVEAVLRVIDRLAAEPAGGLLTGAR